MGEISEPKKNTPECVILFETRAIVAIAVVSSRRIMGERSTGSRSGEHEGDAVEVLVHELGRQEVPDMLRVSLFFETNTPSYGGELSLLGKEMPWYKCFEGRKLRT
jgi:hypothetical protein